ncbi:murein biosynthesis integral membrane protein MurJ [Robertmurraya sp. P23]|uniref:murein biosynthesis integral membrane protein MurJ n=1 Tax=Robertmurraya sp. P23 TaxID=3436931 RepID=UPI003D98CB30
MAKNFGVGEVMDAFNIANILTISSVSVISAAITTVLIPILTKKENLIEEAESINTYISTLLVLCVIFVSGLIIIGEPLIKLFTLNHNQSVQVLTLQLTIIFAISQIFKVITGISTAFFQISNDFIRPKNAGLLAIIISISYFFISSEPNIYGIAITIGLSFLVEIAYLLIMQRKIEFKFRFTFKLSNPTFRLLVKNTFPIILSSAAFQLSIVFANFIASYFGEGYVSIYGYSNQIVSIIHGLIIVNIIMMLYPTIAKKFEENILDAKRSLVQYINLTNLLVIPIVFGFLAVGDILIQVLFERGNFTSENTKEVYIVSAILFLAFPFNTMRDYVYRSFYSLKDTKTPARNSIMVVGITLILIVALTPLLKFYSVAVAPVLTSVISLIFSSIKLKKKIGTLDDNGSLLKNSILVTVSSIIMSLILLLVKVYLFDEYQLFPLIKLIILVVIGVALYLPMVYFTQKKLIQDSVFNKYKRKEGEV